VVDDLVGTTTRYRAGSLVGFETCSPVMDPAMKELDSQLYWPVVYCLVLRTALERYVRKRDTWNPIKRQAYLGMNGEAK